MPLDETASRTVVGRLADSLGLGLEETAAALVNVNNLHAATLIHQQTLERGLDPRDFVLDTSTVAQGPCTCSVTRPR